ncbi:ABC transporter ATP-binding protein [Corticibacter populi]|uniref:ABC transporter ATP-binding protein n=1 Tax=Corticibacter populi TaxID=1550736 RepID=A0A3M6QXW0_9BURK|nr:ABC transporter ATP-binding protein [Corticibacter populi]RMX07751.1 ABC transporter ATP-binding protein [Corticibacter populi]RZS34971.1 peptide/nickel transport system ATP-binding protein [Corticibacter populi]
MTTSMMNPAPASARAAAASPLFSLLDVEKVFPIDSGRRQLKALDGIRLELRPGESLALVGESGSGKSTLVRVMLGLEPASNGRVIVGTQDLASLDRAGRQKFAREVAYIYQDARGSLNPRMTVGALLAEPIRLHRLRESREVDGRVDELLAQVGLPEATRYRYPSELSGGQVRRVAVARALASEPRVIVADESVAGLDVSVQAQLLNLLRDLQRDTGLAMVFVTHDLGVAAYLCERVAVMYLGRIMELGPSQDILRAPRHPYTQGLLQAFPRFDAPLTVSLKGEIPSPANLPQGCRFQSRCQWVQEDCRQTDPVQRPLPGRQVACLHPLPVPESGILHAASPGAAPRGRRA